MSILKQYMNKPTTVSTEDVVSTESQAVTNLRTILSNEDYRDVDPTLDSMLFSLESELQQVTQLNQIIYLLNEQKERTNDLVTLEGYREIALTTLDLDDKQLFEGVSIESFDNQYDATIATLESRAIASMEGIWQGVKDFFWAINKKLNITSGKAKDAYTRLKKMSDSEFLDRASDELNKAGWLSDKKGKIIDLQREVGEEIAKDFNYYNTTFITNIMVPINDHVSVIIPVKRNPKPWIKAIWMKIFKTTKTYDFGGNIYKIYFDKDKGKIALDVKAVDRQGPKADRKDFMKCIDIGRYLNSFSEELAGQEAKFKKAVNKQGGENSAALSGYNQLLLTYLKLTKEFYKTWDKSIALANKITK